MTSKENQICGVCRHTVITHPPVEAAGDQAAQPARLACRRFPPQTHFIIVLRNGGVRAGGQMVPVEEQRSTFPPVMADWSCGEWTPAMALVS